VQEELDEFSAGAVAAGDDDGLKDETREEVSLEDFGLEHQWSRFVVVTTSKLAARPTDCR
jgi:hypothetical protein